jgi:hypothetical protein
MQGNLKPQHQHCLTSQNAHICINMGHLNKLRHDFCHDLALIWLESHKTLCMVGHFRKKF